MTQVIDIETAVNGLAYVDLMIKINAALPSLSVRFIEAGRVLRLWGQNDVIVLGQWKFFVEAVADDGALDLTLAQNDFQDEWACRMREAEQS